VYAHPLERFAYSNSRNAQRNPVHSVREKERETEFAMMIRDKETIDKEMVASFIHYQSISEATDEHVLRERERERFRRSTRITSQSGDANTVNTRTCLLSMRCHTAMSIVRPVLCAITRAELMQVRRHEPCRDPTVTSTLHNRECNAVSAGNFAT